MISSPFRQVMGAVMYGRDQTVVSSRKAKRTIGTCTLRLYQNQLEEHRKRWTNVRRKDGRAYLDIFQCFVEKGADVTDGFTRSVEFAPTTNEQTKVAFKLNISQRPPGEIYFLNDPGVRDSIETMQAVEVDLDMSVPVSDRRVKLQMTFGGAELIVKCIRCSDEREVEKRVQVREDIWGV